MVTDDAGTQAKLARIAIQLRYLTSYIAKPKVTLLQYERTQAQALEILATLEKINGTVSTAQIDIEDATAEQRLAILSVNLAQLVQKARDIRVGLTDSGDIASINQLIGAMGKLGDRVATIDFKAINLDALTQSEADLQLLSQTLGKEFPQAVAVAGFAWRGWATLMNKLPLFGGTTLLPQFLAFISLWHVLADAVIETIAVLVPAGVAFAAFALAASGAADTVVAHLKAVNTVMAATGQAVRPFTNAFQQVQDAVTPAVYELFGEVMLIVNNRIGEFASLATRAAQVMDYFGARIGAAITSSGFQKFLNNAISDLTTVGDIIGNVFGILGNLIRMVAGVAGVLFHAILDITGAVERLTSIPFVQTLGRWVVGFHGAFVWIGLAASAVLGMIPLLARLTGGISAATAEATGFNRIRLAANDLATNTGVLGVRIGNIIPTIQAWASRMVAAGGAAEDAGRGTKILSGLVGIGTTYWPVFAAAATVALAGILIYLSQVETGTEKWIASLQQGIDKTITWSNALTAVSSSLEKVTVALAAAQQQSGNVTKSTGGFTTSVNNLTRGMGTNIQKVQDLTAAQRTFGNEADTIGFRLGTMASRYGDLGLAIGLARLAGIKITDLFKAQGSAWALDLRQIDALVAGYKYMGVASGALGNSVKALQVTSDDQVTAVQQLNQAWTTFLGIVAGGENTFVTFAQQMLTVKQAASGLSSALTTTNGVATSTISPTGRLNTALTASAKAANAAKTNINGLNQSSLQLRQSVGQAISNAQAYYEALQTQSAAASDAARGQMLLAQAGGDILRILGPSARGSATLRQELFALAQQFGFTRGQMEQFIHTNTTVKSNEKDLERVNRTLATSVSNVGKDWAQMATTLKGQVTQALTSVALGTSGAKTAAENLFKAVHSGTPDLATEHYWFKQLVDDLHSSGLTWQQAKDEAEAYTRGIHANWQEIAAGHAARSQLISDTQASLGVTKNTAMQIIFYSEQLKKSTDTTAAGRATRLQLIQDIVNTGIRAGISASAIDNLIAKILKIPTHEAISLIAQATGHYTVTGTTTQFGSHIAHRSAQGGPGSPGAAGMRVPGTGNRDTFPAMLMPGEAVVPKHLVPSIAPFLGAHRVPGFAAGGFAGTGPYNPVAPNLGTSLQGWFLNYQSAFVKALATATINALKSAQQAAQGAFGAPGGIGGNVTAWIRAAMSLGGAPSSWYAALARLVQLESGGNPRAVDPIPVLGQHATGLWQMLPSTARGEGYTGSLFNPVGEGIAAIRYIRSRYGSPYNIPGLFGGGYGGYDSGGWLPPGLSLAWNGTGRPEPVGPTAAGGGLTVNLIVQPGSIMTGNAVQIGQALGQFLLEHTKRGGKLYPQGVTPR